MAEELQRSAIDPQSCKPRAPTAQLRTDDVLACVFSQLELFDGCVGAAFVCKQWHTAWRPPRERAVPPVRMGVGGGLNRFPGGMKALDAGGGVVISDYEGTAWFLCSPRRVSIEGCSTRTLIRPKRCGSGRRGCVGFPTRGLWSLVCM